MEPPGLKLDAETMSNECEEKHGHVEVINYRFLPTILLIDAETYVSYTFVIFKQLSYSW